MVIWVKIVSVSSKRFLEGQESVSFGVEGAYEYSTPFILKNLQTLDFERIKLSFKTPAYWNMRENPFIDDVVSMVYEFGCEVGFFSNSSAIQPMILDKLQKSKFVDLAVNSLPEMTDRNKLAIMAKWILILFKFDDLIDENGSPFKDIRLTKQLVSLLKISCYKENVSRELSDINVLLDGPHQSRVESVVCSMKLLQKNMKDLGLKTREFNKAAAVYFDSAVNELETAEHVEAASYFEHRKKSGAVPTVMTLSYALKGLEMQELIRNTYAFQQMEICGNLAICLVNDGVSGKEWEGDEPNFVKIKYKEAVSAGKSPTCAITSAHLETSRVHNAQILEYEGHKTMLLEQISSGDIFTNDVDIYQESLTWCESKQSDMKELLKQTVLEIGKTIEDLIHSNLYYSKKTDRYILDHDIFF